MSDKPTRVSNSMPIWQTSIAPQAPREKCSQPQDVQRCELGQRERFIFKALAMSLSQVMRTFMLPRFFIQHPSHYRLQGHKRHFSNKSQDATRCVYRLDNNSPAETVCLFRKSMPPGTGSIPVRRLQVAGNAQELGWRLALLLSVISLCAHA
jgi:hypothetical protein